MPAQIRRLPAGLAGVSHLVLHHLHLLHRGLAGIAVGCAAGRQAWEVGKGSRERNPGVILTLTPSCPPHAPRKRCLLLNNFVAIAGAVLMLLSRTARSFEMIMVARLIYGINSGQSEEVSSFPH